jgi:plastocyanin
MAAGGSVVAALAVTGTSGATDKPAPTGGAPALRTGPVASLRPAHRRVVAGRRLLLDASRSTDVTGRIVDYRWDLNGDGVFEKSTGARPRVRHAFRRPGRIRIGVVVIDDTGDRAVGHAKVRVVAAQKPKPHVRKATRHAKPKPAARQSRAQTTVRFAANQGSVTVSDFKFAPKSITINVGESVVWTNNGPTGHSATADDGTFDTGVLSKGSTGMFRFTKAGTYNYHCTPHPFMKASVIVKGSGGSGSSGDSSSNSGNTTSSNHSSKSSSLPHTGLPLGPILFAGYLLFATGAALRRRVLG